MSTVICPNCKASNVRRSQSHGFRERLLIMFNRKAFRCRDRGWRGLLLAPGERSTRATKQQSYVFAVILGTIMFELIVVFNFCSDQVEEIAGALLGNPK